MTDVRPILTAPDSDTLSRKAPLVDVYVNERLHLSAQLMQCSRYVGGRPIDTATIELRLIGSHSQSRIGSDLRTIQDNATVAIETKEPPQQLHFGKIVNVQTRVSGQGEHIFIHSRLDDHLFGTPLDLLEMAEKTGDNDGSEIGHFQEFLMLNDDELVFNPVFEGQATPNALGSYYWNGRQVFIDPRSVPPEVLNNDRRVGDGTAEGDIEVATYWTLADATHYLIQTLNIDQRYIRNPTIAELRKVMGIDLTALRNFRIRKGAYLPEILDSLLRPHGFGWYVQLDNRRQRRICVFEFRKQTTVSLPYMQEGENLEVAKQAVASWDLALDYSQQSFNRIVVLGDNYQRELSVILRPGWNPSHDDQASHNYFDRDGDNWDEDGVPDAWRRFVLNEAGEYLKYERDWWEFSAPLGQILANPEDPPSGDEPEDPKKKPDPEEDGGDDDDDVETDPLITAFWHTRRRRMFPCITQNKDGSAYGTTQGVYLEYWDPDEQSGAWVPVQDKFNFQVLQDEVGIWITDTRPWSRLRVIQAQHGIDKVAIRATASFRADRRVRAEAYTSQSLLSDRKTETIEQRGYQLRQIETTMEKADLETPIGGSVVVNFDDVILDGAIDSRNAAKTLAVNLLRRYNSGLLEGAIELEGIDWGIGPFLGSRIWKMNGRELSLDVAAPGWVPRHPTIVGIEYMVQQQKTRLRIETLRNPGGIRIA